ncbi:BON domain-containing protein [Thermodesulfovibrio thiophilus]|uniref:BON domain-containing protein n=1 Tax=Thermodesulfovibrio thiophilus TaxID=340095 RepID=UPI00184214CB|nr:BON domain-containing protein [Thermodesulfovibrio thiophilus]HHW21056.1 BON domain-containing protein [Thermodesulfovibrio thiophilus]
MKKVVVFLIITLVFVSGCNSLTGRTAGQTIDDSTITTAINMKIMEDSELQYLKINVDTFQGHVTLTGTVPSKEAADRLVKIARGVEGVKTVKTNLIIKPRE